MLKFSDYEKGPGYWKFNNTLLGDLEFVQEMNVLIDEHIQNIIENSDSQVEWELLKNKIRTFSQNYSKIKSADRRNKITQLYNDLNDIDIDISKNVDNEILQKIREKLKLEIEILENYKARAAQVRSRVKWIEQGEKIQNIF